jgi:CBS domain-containing protein
MSVVPAFSESPSIPGRDMPVARAMHAGIVSCPPHVSVAVAARIMAAHRIHAVVVVEPAAGIRWPQVVGVLADVDVLAPLAEGRLEEQTAGDAAMPALCVTEFDPLSHAIRLMEAHRVTHLVVVDRLGRRPVGVLSTLDVAEVIAGGV